MRKRHASRNFSGLPPGTADTPEFHISYEDYDSETLPTLTFGGKATDSTVETEEHKIQYKVDPIFRDAADHENGLVPLWGGPEQDRIVML